MPRKSITESEPKSLAYVDEWVEVLRHQLPETVASWDVIAVHQSRVATRRLRAAISVVEPVLSSGHRKPVEKTLRKLRRLLGPVRDSDVMLGHLDELRPSPGVDWLRGRLTEVRDEQRRRTAAKLQPTKLLAKLGNWWAVRQEWIEMAAAVDGLLANSIHLQLDAFIEHADGMTSDSPSANDPHELRIAGKALRYTLEMAVASGHPLPSTVAKAFKRMQDALGAWHDQVVLADHVTRAALEAGLAYHEPAVHLAVLDVARAAVQRSVRHLAKFSTLWQQRGIELAETIRATFPVAQPGISELTTGVSERIGDLDRPGSAGTPDPALPVPVDPAGA